IKIIFKMWNGSIVSVEGDSNQCNVIPHTEGYMNELQGLIEEMRQQDFDSIRFATYRTACKLRFIQKKANVHLVDIWNMIESFRENALNAVPSHSTLKFSRLELLLTSVFHNLNKRLPTTQHIDTDKSISTLLSFLLGAYDRQHNFRLTIFSVKIALSVLSAGKLVDKLRYIFSQISDSQGIMEWDKFVQFLQQILALPKAVFEAPTFGYTDNCPEQCFQKDAKTNLNAFLDVILSETCPPCLMWLPLLHRMASVEHVYHPVVCDSCQIRSFTGFRYKCQRCSNYQLCQNCFWRGRTSQNHSNEHEMKEYSNYKSPTKQLAHSIHKSLQCIPLTGKSKNLEFDSKLQRPIDLSNIIPVMPNFNKHQIHDVTSDWSNNLLPGTYGNTGSLDDEHKLIARYAAKLSGRQNYKEKKSNNNLLRYDGVDNYNEKMIIAQLEEENSEMLRELAAIERQNNLIDNNGQLSGLKEKKFELENKMRCMQNTRKELMYQLEQLMKQLNTTDSGRSYKSMSQMPETLTGVNSRITNAFREHSLPTNNRRSMSQIPASQLQGDLLQAADAITENVSEFIHELDMANEDISHT
uniref:Dystrobrevin n=1 Tax=Strongyloides stercoralis TaxID=6248 RepID=A0AAF5DFZ2_STRER